MLELIGIVIVITLPIFATIMYAHGRDKKDAIGMVACRRCGYLGKIKAEFRPFKGNVLVCSKCGSEDWVKSPAVQRIPPKL